MSEKSFVYTAQATTGSDGTVSYDRVVQAADFRHMLASLVGNGVYADPVSNLKVSAGSTAMTVSVAAGQAWVEGAYYISDSAITLTIPTADGSNPRIDSVVLRASESDRAVNVKYIQGTAAASPTAPEPVRSGGIYDLVLARVSVARGAVSITQSAITDTRFNASLCGQVKATLETIDTTDLFAQYDTAFTEWFTNLRDQLTSNQATNLQSQIDDLTTSLSSTTIVAKSAKNIASNEVTLAENWRSAYGGIIDVTYSSDHVFNGAFVPKFDISREYSTGARGLAAYWGTYSSSTGNLTIKHPGWYLCTFGLHISDVAGDDAVHVRLYSTRTVDSTSQDINIAEGYFLPDDRTGKQICSGTVTGMMYLKKGDNITPWVYPGCSVNYRVAHVHTFLTVAPFYFPTMPSTPIVVA